MGTKKIKICFISHTADLGGGERSLIQLTKSLKKHGLDITVVIPQNGPIKKELSQTATIIETPYSWWTVRRGEKRKNLKKDFNTHILCAIDLYKKIKEKKFDLIITNTSLVCEGAIAALLLKIPHIWHIRELGEKDHGFIFKFGLRTTSIFIDKFSDRIIFNSEATLSEFKKYIDLKKTAVVYNSISIDPELTKEKSQINYLNKKSLKIINAGTISKRKGQLDAVKAIIKLLKEDINVELILIGGNTDKTLLVQINNLIQKSGFPEKFQILEFQKNPYPIIGKANILLVNSKNEAFGRTIIEGMLLKKPVIATNSGGVPEIIHNGINGLLYKPKDFIELSNKIMKIKNNNKLKRKLIKNGYTTATKVFNDKNYSGKVLKIIREVSKLEQVDKNIGNFKN